MLLCYKRFSGWALFCCIVLTAGSLPASVADPLSRIRQTVHAVLDVLSNNTLTPKEQQHKIRPIVLQRFDFKEMARRSLAQHWHDISARQQREFVKVFTNLLFYSYLDKIRDFNEKKGKIEVFKEAIDRKYASVYSRIISEHNPDHEMKYRLLKRGDTWQVYDVIIDGISLINNYRIQFDKIIYEESYKDLLDKMQFKLKQIRSISPAS